MISPSDALATWGLVQQIDPSPVGLLGRVIGLGSEERQQIPGWVWYAGAGILAGGLAVWAYRELSVPTRTRIFATR